MWNGQYKHTSASIKGWQLREKKRASEEIVYILACMVMWSRRSWHCTGHRNQFQHLSTCVPRWFPFVFLHIGLKYATGREATTTKTGPNNVSDVVWTLGECFLSLFCTYWCFIVCYDFNPPNKWTTVSRFRRSLVLSSSSRVSLSRVPDN